MRAGAAWCPRQCDALHLLEREQLLGALAQARSDLAAQIDRTLAGRAGQEPQVGHAGKVARGAGGVGKLLQIGLEEQAFGDGIHRALAGLRKSPAALPGARHARAPSIMELVCARTDRCQSVAAPPAPSAARA